MDRFAPALRGGVVCVALFSIPVGTAGEPVTGSITPGTVQDTIEQQPPEPPLPTEAAPGFERAGEQDRGAPLGPAIPVEAFILNGNERIDNETLQAELAAWRDRALTLSDIYDAADHLTAFYRERGFGLAQVTVPAQKINDGTVELQVIEGRIGAVSVEGNEDYSFEFLKRRLEPLNPGRVYTDAGMERSVLLLNDLPGLDARAVIRPGEAFGTSDILFRLQEDPAEFSVSADNYGRDELGEIRLLADAQFNNLAGIGDRLYVAILYSDEGLLKYGNVTYGVPTGSNGSRLRVTLNRADYEVGGDLFEDLGLTGDNTTYRVDWSYPLLRSRARNTVFTIAAQRFETESLIADIEANASELDLIELGFFMNGLTDADHSWSFSTILDGNGKSNGETLAEARTDAQQAKLRLDGTYGLPFGNAWLFATRATWVYSAEPLTDSQKFSLGGPYSVRGYAPAEQRGDAGAFLSLELRKYLHAGGYPLAGVVFVDGGMARSQLPIEERDADPLLEGELASAGVGLLLSPDAGTFSGALIYATPIDNHESFNGDDDGHVWATFTVRF